MEISLFLWYSVRSGGGTMEKTNLSKCCRVCKNNKYGNNSLICQSCHNETMQERKKREYESKNK